MSTRDPQRTWRRQAILSGVLVLVALVLAHRLNRGVTGARWDLTEEQLSVPSPVGVRMLRELEDVLEVRAFFTGEVELGIAQLAKRRLVDQLEEAKRLSSGRLALAFRDPNKSSEARAEAYALGIVSQAIGAVQGSSALSQDLFLGLVLRYRGREEVLPFVLPQSFEYAFLSAVRRLQREAEPVVGLLRGTGDGSAGAFTQLPASLAGGREVRALVDLDVSGHVPEDVDAVLVVGPRNLHPRVAFALDQFVQRGGRLAVFAEPAECDPAAGTVRLAPTGLEALLATWGAGLSERIVWDVERANPIGAEEVLGANGQVREVRVAYPAWVGVQPDTLNEDEVLTSRLAGLDLFWAHPFLPADVAGVPDGVERVVLAESSEKAFAVEPRDELLVTDPSLIQGRSIELLARNPGQALPLALLLRGRFPSPFQDGAPAPFDPVAAAVHAEAVAAAEEAGQEPPPPPPIGRTDEAVASASADGVVFVVGDADCLRDGGWTTPRNRMLLEDLVDWMTLEDDLLALRARQPEPRPLRDFLAEAREARDLPAMAPGESIPAEDTARLKAESEAAREAARRRWVWTGAATGGSLLLGLALALAGRFALARGTYEEAARP